VELAPRTRWIFCADESDGMGGDDVSGESSTAAGAGDTVSELLPLLSLVGLLLLLRFALDDSFSLLLLLLLLLLVSRGLLLRVPLLFSLLSSRGDTLLSFSRLLFVLVVDTVAADDLARGRLFTSSAVTEELIVNDTTMNLVNLNSGQLRTELHHHSQQLAALRSRCRALELELDSKHAALLALESKSAAGTANSTADEHMVLQLARQLVAERAQLAKLKADKSRISHEIASKSTELASQKRQIAKLHLANNALEQACIAAEAQMVREVFKKNFFPNGFFFKAADDRELSALAERYRTEIEAMEASVTQIEERAQLAVAREATLEVRQRLHCRAHRSLTADATNSVI
jgi:hypothetical protein